jgi:hypothetical protein
MRADGISVERFSKGNTMSDELTITVGTVLIFEYGEYSDFGYCGPFRVEKEIDRAREAAAYREQWKPDLARPYAQKPDEDGFPIWLMKEGFISDISPATSWHIGSYGTFEP